MFKSVFLYQHHHIKTAENHNSGSPHDLDGVRIREWQGENLIHELGKCNNGLLPFSPLCFLLSSNHVPVKDLQQLTQEYSYSSEYMNKDYTDQTIHTR